MARTSHSRRRILQASGVAIATALAGCGGGGGTADDGSVNADYTVTLGGDQEAYDPQTVEPSVGETVGWQVEGGDEDHFLSVTSGPDDGWAGPGASAISETQTHTHTFEVAGTYVYESDSLSGQGTVEVTESE